MSGLTLLKWFEGLNYMYFIKVKNLFHFFRKAIKKSQTIRVKNASLFHVQFTSSRQAI